MLSRIPLPVRARPSPLAGLFLLLLAGVLAVSGCNTVSGMGEDISEAGRGIDQTSERTQEKITGQEHTQPQRSQEYQSGRY